MERTKNTDRFYHNGHVFEGDLAQKARDLNAQIAKIIAEEKISCLNNDKEIMFSFVNPDDERWYILPILLGMIDYTHHDVEYPAFLGREYHKDILDSLGVVWEFGTIQKNYNPGNFDFDVD